MSAGERRCYKDRLNSRNPGENERYMRESRPSRSQTTVIDRKCLDTISPWAVRISLNVLSSTSYRKLKFEEYIAGEDETVSHLGLQVYSSYVHQPIEIDTEFIDLSSLHFGLSASFRVNAHDPVYRRVLRQICVADSKDLVALTQAGKIPPWLYVGERLPSFFPLLSESRWKPEQQGAFRCLLISSLSGAPTGSLSRSDWIQAVQDIMPRLVIVRHCSLYSLVLPNLASYVSHSRIFSKSITLKSRSQFWFSNWRDLSSWLTLHPRLWSTWSPYLKYPFIPILQACVLDRGLLSISDRKVCFWSGSIFIRHIFG